MTFNVKTSMIAEAAAVVTVEGELDLFTAPRLQEALLNAIETGHTGVLVDLTGSTFVDSTTLGLLMGSFERLTESGGTLAVACHDPNLRRIFQITLLDQVFPVFDSREDGETYVLELVGN